MRFRSLLSFRFKKRLPQEFGGGSVWVTGRSDVRVLKPGWNACALDLMLVTRHIVEPGMCVWDIGSNLGILAAMAAGRAGPDGEVFALEADPDYASLISRTVSELPANYAPITVLCAAIAQEYGVMSFGVSKKGHARNKLLSDDQDSEKLEMALMKQVVTVSGDDLLRYWSRPSFVKIDVEGAELMALNGSPKLLSEARPIFYIEVSEINASAVTDLLRSHDYDIFNLKGDGREEPVELCTFYTIARPR